ncbi:hypothetical protein SPRG_18793 [Saprolegnia parasitica CBS 223.65]|uniref:Uncharacterized protein n=1 Tax=Saprolegnia parasitica (strain CBS 223.65) TaxID=695850 RepID=A0A067D1X5_SAPPC|nr:hypothetical protein SPRG_18793 [Saprolegnia parasitica CBS 223.65]KDO35505.1 hypothetical protein SPRG_18793 [Saprolegnia parasitica CBS 223.65]|eukprot:XP_012194015.1 hypothetical protein SPRG_18793 [Saprolegnia parasitica CBS 223.65]
MAMGADQLGLERLAIDALGASMRALNHCVDSIRSVPLDATAAMTDNILQAMGIKDADLANVGSVVASRLVALLQGLAAAITEGEALEITRPPDANPAKPRAPLCLLSLRDYTGVQAAIELLVTWGIYPCVEAGILVPLEQRVVSKTMKIAKHVVAHGSQLPTASPHDQLYTVVACLLNVLQLSQFKPMLLPAYLRDIFAALVYERHVSQGPHSLAAQKLLDALVDDLPLRVTMSSVRAVLGQCHRSPNVAFKTQCGLLLTACVLKPGGVHSTVEVLLSTVDEGNTQARMHVASLIARCPRGYERDAYLAAVAPQLLQLLSAKDMPKAAKLLRETTGLIVCQLILEYPLASVDTTLLQPLLGPLLRVEGQPRAASLNRDAIHFIATEDELGACLAALNVMLLGPPPPAPVLLALAPCFRPLVLLYAFCVASKSYWKETVQQLLAAYVQAAPFAALLLQSAVAPMNPTHRTSLQPLASASHLACTFSAGGSGGAAITALDSSYPIDSIVAGIVDLLQAPALEACDVVGDLFTSLLTSYMQLKTGVAASSSPIAGMDAYAAVVQAPENAPSMLQLLVALTEVVGPAVLRSGASILQCLVTVIDMYTSSTSMQSSMYDAPLSDDDDDETAMDVLSVCLGMVTTILEVGARDRSPHEEALLKQLLPSLEALSTHQKVDIAEMASELRLQLLARAANTVPEPKLTALTFANILALSEKDLQSPSVPLRARGLVRLNKLIRSREAIDVAALTKLFLAHLHDAESYVFLASIQALASLADMHPTIAIPMLLDAATDTKKTLSLDQRIKLSEALMFTARRCGDVLPAYSRGFVYAYLGAIRTTSATTDLADATYRASCLSNLAEVCGLLRWAIHPFLTDVLLCVKDVLQVERGRAEPQIALRRGAVFVLNQMLHLMGRDVFAIASEHMTPIYRLLKGVAGDSDGVCVFHATQALAELDVLMRGELFQVGRGMKRALEVSATDATQARAKARSDLDKLGEEGVVRHVLSYLDVKDHHVAKAVCRGWKSLIETLDMAVLDLSVRSPLHAKNLEAAFLSTINSYRDVRTIDFTGQRSLCDRDLLVLTSCFWSSLETIVVDDCLDITDFGLLAILNAQSQRLHTVSFRNCKLVTGRFAQTAITGHHPSLRTLDFHNTRVNLGLVQHLESRFPSLQSIVATHTPAHYELLRAAPWGDLQAEWARCVAHQLTKVHFSIVLEDFAALQKRVPLRTVFEKTLLSSRKALVDMPLESESYSSALLHVCEHDIEDVVHILLSVGADVEVTNKDGATPLCLAATSGCLGAVDALIVATLLAHNARTDAATTSNTTPLCVAAKNGSRSSVRQLIRHRSRRPSFVHAHIKPTPEWVLALCLACERSHHEIVLDLLNLGLDPNVLMDNGVTPLYLACQMGHHTIVETLLARGADPNFTRAGGVSCLYIASQEGKLDVVGCLTKYHVDVTATMDDKSAALHIAARMGHRDIALHLLMHGADPNGQTRSGLTPLLIACEEGHVALVAYLLSLPIVQLDRPTHNGTTPLFIACQRGFRDIVALLLAAGANVNVAKANGTSPIDAASMLGHRDVVTLLLRHGARVGGLALHFAERRKDTTLLALLLHQHQAQWYAPHVTAMVDYVQ